MQTQPARLDTLTTIVAAGMANQAYPGAMLAYGRGDEVTYRSFGRLDLPADSPEPDEHTVYDLASLTKVVATWPLVGLAFDEGRFTLSTPIGDLLAEPGLPGSACTVVELLTHTSGLMASTYLRRYDGAASPLARSILSEPLDGEPGEQVVYINRGFILLGLALERVYGQPLAELAAARVWAKTGMHDTRYGPVRAPYRVAPTEPRPGTDQPLCGVVHDENAEYLSGAAGHAGVFSTAADLAAFCRAMLDTATGKAGAFAASPGYVRDAWRRWVTDGDRDRGLAWIIRNPQAGPAARVVYHHGFTGTSIFLVPDRDEYLVLLTNKIRINRERAPMAQVRDAALHALI